MLVNNNDFRRGSGLAGVDQVQRSDSETEILRSASKTDLPGTDFPVHDFPGLRNYAFVGRKDVLFEMHEFFTRDRRSRPAGPNCCVIHGLGGQGKSQTALEYTYKHTAYYDVIFWLEAEEEQDLTRSYSLIAKKLKLPESESLDEGQDPTKGVQDAQKWFGKAVDVKWLLIFDNLEDERNLPKYLPKSSGSVIITTQKPHMMAITEDFHKIPLQALDPETGATLLAKYIDREYSGKEELQVGKSISDWVGGLPLALATIGGYIRQSGETPEYVFQSLRRSSTVWASRGQEAIANYTKTLATVFDLALGELTENAPSARHLLDVLAFLNPDHISQDILTRDQNPAALQYLNNQDEFLAITYDLGLRQLIKRSKAGTKDSFLSIHRSLQRNLLHTMHGDQDKVKRQRIFEEAFTIVRNVLPRASTRLDSEPELWPIFSKYVPQVISLRNHSVWPDPPLLLGLHVARMLCDIGTFLWHTGQFNDCSAALDTAESIVKAQSQDKQESPESKALLSDVYNFTGIICDIIGVSKRDDSIRIRRACLDLRQETHKTLSCVTVDDEIRLETAWSDLGCSLMQLGKYDEAGKIFNKMFEAAQRWGPEEEYLFEYAKYYHHCAFVRMAQGKPSIAVEFAKRGVELQRRHENDTNTMVLINMYDLASLLYNAGAVSQSLELHEEVLRLRLQSCGEASQFTLESYESAATIHYLTGSLAKAEEYLRQCLDWQRRAYWTEEGIARARYRLSQVLRARGEITEAEEELRAAREVRDKFLKEYPQHLKDDPHDEVAVFDQMLPMWVSQFTGKLQEGGRLQSCQVPELDYGALLG